jgi:NADH:ubiquinone oxidoreductase subunit 5 (subunit L)/multisubunit Na+/H+ antiporter MnhA subunit
VLAHAAFKTLAFLAAGSVLAGTGLRNLDKMGGLARTMPITTVFFAVAALGACGLPLGAGFVSEWLLVQSLIHAPHGGSALLSLALPLAIATVALTTGLGVAAMVKAFGIGFLGRPRTQAADQAREASASMLTGMAIASSGCIVLAVAPMFVGSALRHVLATLPAGGHAQAPRLGAFLRLPSAAGSIAPGWLALGLVTATALAGLLTRWNAHRRPTPTTSPLWASGANRLSSRMQYTATSFAEPLQRVFDDVLRPDIDIQVSHYDESHYLVERVAFRARLSDAIEEHLYVPVVAAVQTGAGWVRRAHTGSVHLYLAFGAMGLLVVLIVAR